MTVRILEGLRFPEGPAFAPGGTLWGVEVQGGTLFEHHEPSRRHLVGGSPVGLAFASNGEPVFCDQERGAVRVLVANGSTLTLVDRAEGASLNRPNDLAYDAAGNLVFTCPGHSRVDPTGSVWCLGSEGEVSAVVKGLRFPNGLAFSPDGRTLVVAETYGQRLWKGAWDGCHRRWIDPQPWAFAGGPNGPDGVAYGADGTLFVAVFGLGLVKRFSPAGELIEQMVLPGSQPTNVAFDPRGRLGLVVTEAQTGAVYSIPTAGPGAALFTGRLPEAKR
jgi:gluconolactonase